MLTDEEELRKIKETQARFSGAWKGAEIAPFDDEKMLHFHKKMKSLAERMLQDDVDLDKEGLVFVLSSEPSVNAAYCHGYQSDDNADGFIYFTADLLKFCENEDQLAFVLAHELEHYLIRRQYGPHVNTKPEETVADIRAIDKMVKAGMNLEEASKFAAKTFSSSRVVLRDIMDEHLSGENRISFVKARVTAEKDRLRRAELANPEVTEDVTHAMDDTVLEMANNLPVSESIRDFFESAQYRLMQERINDGRGLSSEEMNSVREAFTACYPTFFGHLAELCHTSEHEQIICMLIKLNFSFSNMSLLTHHSPSSISKTRKRLAVRAFGDDAETSAIDGIVRQL